MKKKKLVRQFQKHILFTVVIIALMAGISVFVISQWRTKILPNDSELFVDVTSTFADGTERTDTYRLESDKADGSQEFKKENTVEEENPKLFAVYTADGEEEDNVLLINASNVQTGTTVSVSKIQNGFSKLSESQQRTYLTLGYLRFVLPMIYSLFGVIISCVIFYRSQMKRPIEILEAATEKISNRNLDFQIHSNCKNELGRLCDSFEQMREALVENNEEMFQMMDERRRLQSSVAHDLRNPIAIMKGYLEMMEGNASGSGAFRNEIRTLTMTVDRMEKYVNSVSEINQLGDMELELEEVDVEDCIAHWERDMQILAKSSGIEIVFLKDNLQKSQDNVKWIMDVDAISRVLENIIKNSCRYAKSRITVNMDVKGQKELIFEIEDDGPGYPEKLIRNADLYFFTTEQKSGHMGMGITICRIICKKHQGSITILNNEKGGAKTIIKIKNFQN